MSLSPVSAIKARLAEYDRILIDLLDILDERAYQLRKQRLQNLRTRLTRLTHSQCTYLVILPFLDNLRRDLERLIAEGEVLLRAAKRFHAAQEQRDAIPLDLRYSAYWEQLNYAFKLCRQALERGNVRLVENSLSLIDRALGGLKKQAEEDEQLNLDKKSKLVETASALFQSEQHTPLLDIEDRLALEQYAQPGNSDKFQYINLDKALAHTFVLQYKRKTKAFSKVINELLQRRLERMFRNT